MLRENANNIWKYVTRSSWYLLIRNSIFWTRYTFVKKINKFAYWNSESYNIIYKIINIVPRDCQDSSVSFFFFQKFPEEIREERGGNRWVINGNRSRGGSEKIDAFCSLVRPLTRDLQQLTATRLPVEGCRGFSSESLHEDPFGRAADNCDSVNNRLFAHVEESINMFAIVGSFNWIVPCLFFLPYGGKKRRFAVTAIFLLSTNASQKLIIRAT